MIPAGQNKQHSDFVTVVVLGMMIRNYIVYDTNFKVKLTRVDNAKMNS